jgi:hypothetical protein
MAFEPELQDRIDAVRAKLGGGDQISDVGQLATLKRKLATRDGRGGFSANAADLKARIAELEGQDA